MKTQFISSPDGVRIAYDINGQGPALMLLHGAGKDRQDWHKLGYVERLESDFTGITVDIRGSRESEFLTQLSDFAIEKVCADLNAVADACDAQRIAIWGYSFGGNIARYLGAWPSIQPIDLKCPVILLVSSRNKNLLKYVQSEQSALDAAGIQMEIINGLNHQQEFSQIDQVFPVVCTFLNDRI